VLPPLIIDAGLRLCLRSSRPVRDGALLGLLATAQLFISEELLLLTAFAGVLLVAVLAVGRPQAVPGRLRTATAGLGVAAGVTLLLFGYPLWAQFFGPLTQRGSPFTPDFFKNDLTGFVTPSGRLLFHTSASAAAASYQGGPPEYLAYLGWPLIAALAIATATCWRQPAVRATAVTVAVLELLSLGGHPLIGGTLHPGVTLPWHWLQSAPLIQAMLPNRMSVVADGAAAALLAFALDRAKQRLAGVRGLPVVATAVAAAVGHPPAPAGRLVRHLRRAAPAHECPRSRRSGPDRHADRCAALAGGHRPARIADRRLLHGPGLEWPGVRGRQRGRGHLSVPGRALVRGAGHARSATVAGGRRPRRLATGCRGSGHQPWLAPRALSGAALRPGAHSVGTHSGLAAPAVSYRSVGWWPGTLACRDAGPAYAVCQPGTRR